MALTNGKLTGNRCRCSVCGEVFSTLSGFDSHRRGKYGSERKCVLPSTVNLRIVETYTGTVWKGLPNPLYAAKDST